MVCSVPGGGLHMVAAGGLPRMATRTVWVGPLREIGMCTVALTKKICGDQVMAGCGLPVGSLEITGAPVQPCAVCGFVVVAAGHVARCRVPTYVGDEMKAQEWLGDTMHGLHVREVVLAAGVPVKMRSIRSTVYTAGAAQAAYHEQCTGATGTVNALSAMFESQYASDAAYREKYGHWLCQQFSIEPGIVGLSSADSSVKKKGSVSVDNWDMMGAFVDSVPLVAVDGSAGKPVEDPVAASGLSVAAVCPDTGDGGTALDPGSDVDLIGRVTVTPAVAAGVSRVFQSMTDAQCIRWVRSQQHAELIAAVTAAALPMVVGSGRKADMQRRVVRMGEAVDTVRAFLRDVSVEGK